jgi:hypothetical protein
MPRNESAGAVKRGEPKRTPYPPPVFPKKAESEGQKGGKRDSEPGGQKGDPEDAQTQQMMKFVSENQSRVAISQESQNTVAAWLKEERAVEK